VRPWIARKAAETTRDLTPELIEQLDARLARWAPTLSWGRIEALIAAFVIHANPDAAAQAAAEAEQAQGVWVGRGTEHGIKDIYIRTETPNAIWFDASIERIADQLAALGDTTNHNIRRARAVGILAQPQQALQLITQTAPAAADNPAAHQPPPATQAGVDARPPATLYVHLHQQALTDEAVGGVARLEGDGPITVDQVRRWLGHCQVTVRPVLNLADQAPVDAYEIPERLREVVHLRNPVDIFPYATNTSRRRDIDHTIPYRPPDHGGPPAQTSLNNLGPMTRFHHRVKTHSRWQLRQPFPGMFIWRTPHGRYHLVDHTGTHTTHTAA
jgi:hypothetical protein